MSCSSKSATQSVISGMSEAAKAEAIDESDVVIKHDALIRSLARRFSFDRDDLEQIGRIALIEAAREWQNKEHRSQFWTYARKHVFGEMLNHVTREIARSSFEGESAIEGESFVPADVVLEAKEHVESLSDKEQRIVAALAAGSSWGEICDEQRVSMSTISWVLEKIRKRA